MNERKSVFITHMVNPHHFYFKYLHECICHEKFTKFDFELQKYGNDLYSKKTYANGYTPNEDDLVIFFHLIFNKWVRGKVVSIGEQINLWCIDNGTFEKSTTQLILSLNPKYHANFNLVHLGGLSLLPAEKTFNIHTASIEMQPINMWNLELISIFKAIINNAKIMNFTEEFHACGHTFGLLEVEAKNGTMFSVNDKYMEMNKSMKTDRLAEDILIYVDKIRLQDELYKSDDDALSNVVNNNHSSSSSTMESKSNDNNNSTVTPGLSLSQSGIKVSKWINQTQSEYAESVDFADSASMMISTMNGQDTSSSCQNGENGISTTPNNNLDVNYKCHLGTCSFYRGDYTVRSPLPSTLDWINSRVKSNRSRVTVENLSQTDESFAASSIVNLSDNVDSTQSICSVSSNESETNRNNRILGLLATYKSNTIEKSTGLNGILQQFNSNVDIKNKPTSRLNVIPAGYQLNALHTFGDSKR